MAVIFSTGFESYADGEQSLLDNGWTGPIVPGAGERCAVVSSDAHDGSKSCMCGDDLTPDPIIDTPQLISRSISVSGASVSVSAWAKKPILACNGLQILFFHSAGAFEVQVANTAAIDGGAGVQLYGPGGLIGQANGVVPAGTYYLTQLQMHMSTVNDTLDGVNSDGCVTLSIDGAVVVSVTGAPVYVTNTGWSSGLNHAPDRVQFSGSLWLDDISINDDAMACGSSPDPDPPGDTPPTDTSAPCCGTEPDTPLGPNPGNIPNPPLQPWDRQCAGGGLVPTAADVVDAESWSL